jgi:hypothetical protein
VIARRRAAYHDRPVDREITPRLAAIHHPVAVKLHLPGLAARAAEAELELVARASLDRDGCCGYFPVLEGVHGIDCDLPTCRAFSTSLPTIDHGGSAFRFNFLRLSLKQQSAHAAYHLDSDAATALTGDVATIRRRRVERLLLNLSSRNERTLRYLDVDSRCVDLVADGSYIRAADPRRLAGHARTAKIPPRRGSHVAALLFAANVVLHSGVDDVSGHFVAAYGIDEVDHNAAADCVVQNAVKTSSRSSLCIAG